MNKHIINQLLLLLILVTYSVTSSAQEKKDTSSNQSTKHSLGVGAGYSTGYGISYRYLSGKIGAQVNFAPFAETKRSIYSAGLTFLYRLRQKKNTSVYLYQGNHFYYKKEEITPSLIGAPYDVKTEKWINSIGFGIEFNLSEDIGLNLMTGFASYSQTGLNLTAETAVYYKF
ncbi:MAG TPA: hypothetical protein VK202_03900 [Bacteroidia bacterium]|nr:hypothetical protein [Bacteroidia bacterium]